MPCTLSPIVLTLLLGHLAVATGMEPFVNESAREIPVARETDVVVVGGGSGAVSAAVSAARKGANVFLLAPRPYLGDDLAGTLDLSLELGEKPAGLAERIFSGSRNPLFANGFDFTYQASRPSAGQHRDTNPPTMLRDKEWSSPVSQSVQYDDDVQIVADLGQERALRNVSALVFEGHDYGVASVTIEFSGDGKDWRHAATIKNESREHSEAAFALSASMDEKARYVRCTLKKGAKAKRILVGEIHIDDGTTAVPAGEGLTATPMQVKRELDRALSEAGVELLYGCLATDVLRDAQGQLAGIVMANRAGRQAVLARTIIDATPDALVARLAGAKFHPFVAGPQIVKWVVLAKKPQETAPDLTVRKLERPVGPIADRHGDGGVVHASKNFAWYEYALRLDLPDAGWPARAELEQRLRDRLYTPSQVYAADEPMLLLPQSIQSVATVAGEWPGAGKLDMGVFRPEGVARLWVLGPCAGLSREHAARLARPLASMEAGERVGEAAAAEAHGVTKLESVTVNRSQRPPSARTGEVKESLEGLRPFPKPSTVPQPAGTLPVLGEYDVVVIGGGTSGAPAGIGSARQGAKTLVVEYLHALGGVGTAGLIGKYWYGNRVGFTSEVPAAPTEVRMEWYRSELRKAKADIWFGVLGCGAYVENGRVKGAVVATPCGRGVVLAGTVIDATGSADTAIAAGAEYLFIEDDFALQASHLPSRNPGQTYVNGDRPPIDDADPLNVRLAIRDKLSKSAADFDLAQLIDSRERRRIVGDYRLDWLDIASKRTFPDSIVYGCSDYDSHGYQIHPFFTLGQVPPKTKFWSYVPYRCLLPRNLDGMLVVGLGVSADRDAMPIIRMQPDLHNMGYAAGVAGAMAARANGTVRKIDMKALQRHLVEVGNLPSSVLDDRDSFPLSEEKMRAAVASVLKDGRGFEVLLTQPRTGVALLREAFERSAGKERLRCAHALAAMGDATGLPELLEAVSVPEDPAAQHNRGWGGRAGMIRAMANTKDRRAIPVLLDVLREPNTAGNFQLVRALTLSLGRTGDPAAAAPLAELLGKPQVRSQGLARLMTASALLRCGDKDGLGRQTLEEFLRQDEAPFARAAWQVLKP